MKLGSAMEKEKLKHARILIVDDQAANIELLKRMLEHDGYTAVESTMDSASVVPMCAQQPPDLLILDLHMPDPDGFEVLAQLKPWFEGRWFPVLVVTADVTVEAKQRALSGGARDFLTKPFDMVEVLLRIKNLLEVRFLQLEARKQNLVLEQLVYDRTRDLDEARVEALSRLALAAEYRDDTTGEHTQRVGRTSAAIAQVLGLRDRAGLADPARRSAARRRQDRPARRHPAEAGAADRRRARRDEDARVDRALDPVRQPLTAAEDGRGDRVDPPRALGRQGLSDAG